MPIRKRNGKYQVRVSVGGGERIEVTLPAGATPRDAKLQEAKLLRAKIDVQNGIRPRLLIADALQTWEDTEARLLKSYEMDLKYRIAVLREHFIAGKHIDELEAVATKVKEIGVKAGAAPATMNRLLAILRRLSNLNKSDQKISLLPGERKRQVFLTPDQVKLICEHADRRLIVLIMFLALTGLRLGEALRLEQENIRNGLIILDSDTKSDEPRSIPLVAQARVIAEQCIPFELGRSNVSKLWRAARAAAGFPKVRLHDLRHTFASWIIQAGKPMTAVRDLLGHSSLAVTSRYSHLAPAHLADAVAGLPVLREASNEEDAAAVSVAVGLRDGGAGDLQESADGRDSPVHIERVGGILHPGERLDRAA